LAWDIETAINHLFANAHEAPNGYCGVYVRQAINAGGLNAGPGGTAANYGPNLVSQGVQLIETVAGISGDSPWTTTVQPGDVVIMEATNVHPSGRAQMHSGPLNRGSYWISDYKQRSFWLHSSTRPGLRIYRHPLSHQTGPPVVVAPDIPTKPTRSVRYPGQTIRIGQRGDRVKLVQEHMIDSGGIGAAIALR